MSRYIRWIVYLPCLLATCWLGMMLVHECGHVLATWVSEGIVQHVELPLLGFSRTDVNPNPHPLFVTWAGPVFGALLPLLVALVLGAWAIKSHLATTFSGFCLLANGSYITVGSLQRVGDAGDLMRYGSSQAVMWLVGALFIAGAFWQWHRLGPYLGCAERPRGSDMIAATAAVPMLLATSLLLARP
jgi:hypothetical protein